MPEQLELPFETPLSPEEEEKTSQRIWRGSQTTHHLASEARDYITLSWSMRMATALEKKPPTFPKDAVAGTLRHVGGLQEVVLFLTEVGLQRCACRREWEEQNQVGWDLAWAEEEGNHQAACIPSKARTLLGLLESGET